jgi:hypothetical protein
MKHFYCKLHDSCFQVLRELMTMNSTREIPRQGNTSVIQLSIYHRRLLGDDCLGLASIFLKDFQPTSNPKLMTYPLQGKSEKYPSQGQVTVSILFKQIEFGDTRKNGQPRKSMKVIAEEVIMSQGLSKPKAMSLRNIAQAFLSERRSQCKAVENSGLDSNDNVVKAVVRPQLNLVRVQSARGKINAKIQTSSDQIYIRQKIVPRPRNSSSNESEGEDEHETPGMNICGIFARINTVKLLISASGNL